MHFADMDNDGWLDIVSSGYGPGEGNLRIYWNNGDGTFSENQQYLYGSNDSSCSLCDLDADGYMDIVVTGFPVIKVRAPSLFTSIGIVADATLKC